MLSYNVLAQELLEKNAFLYDWSDVRVLEWNYRRQLLLNEIKQFNADVSYFIVKDIVLNFCHKLICYTYKYLIIILDTHVLTLTMH